MIEAVVTHNRLIKEEPQIDDLISDTEIDTAEIISEAFDEMQQDVKDRGKELRRLCKRLYLQISAVKTAGYDAVKSGKDVIERLRWYVDITAVTGAPIFTLKGTDDESGETYSTIGAMTFAEIQKNSITFRTPYKYYRLTLSGTFTTVTFESYLVETSFERPLMDLAFSKIYNRLRIRNGSDVYRDKSEEYYKRYLDRLNNMRFWYDIDDDGEITKYEGASMGQVYLGRG